MTKIYDGLVLMMVALVDTLVRDVVVFSGSIGVAQTGGLVGENISVDTVGVYEFTCATVDAVAVGDALYWDGAELTVVATANTLAGVAWSAKAGAVAGTVQVKIG